MKAGGGSPSPTPGAATQWCQFPPCSPSPYAAELVRLKDKNYRTRVKAIEALAQLAEKVSVVDAADREQVMVAISDRLEDESPDVRAAVVTALTQLAEEGFYVMCDYCGVIPAVSSLLEDGCDVVRAAAVRAVAQFAEKGNASAVIAMVSFRLGHGMRARARDSIFPGLYDGRAGRYSGPVDALVQLAEKCNADTVIAAVLARLKQGDPFIRAAAVHALSRLARKSDAEVIKAVADRLKDESNIVRAAAVAALAQLWLSRC